MGRTRLEKRKEQIEPYYYGEDTVGEEKRADRTVLLWGRYG